MASNSQNNRIVDEITDFSGIYARKIYPILKKYIYGGDFAGKYCVSVMSSRGVYEAKVLNIGCGDGTDDIYMTSKGYMVDGLDISKEFIEMTKKVNPQGEFYNISADGDWGTIKKRYDVVCTWGTFAEFSNPEKVCSNVASVVKVGGLFIFDYASSDAVWEDVREWRDDLGDNYRDVVRRVHGDPKIRDTRYVYHIDGKEIVVHLKARLNSLWDVASCLRPNFDIVSAYSGCTFDPVKWQKDRYVTIVAIRR